MLILGHHQIKNMNWIMTFAWCKCIISLTGWKTVPSFIIHSFIKLRDHWVEKRKVYGKKIVSLCGVLFVCVCGKGFLLLPSNVRLDQLTRSQVFALESVLTNGVMHVYAQT